ncbi:MAG: enoyl-ACP reductase FabI [Burkholderiales bacterium]|nr:enoyl-ACP reductase FabI [Burkholderiales bacterium]
MNVPDYLSLAGRKVLIAGIANDSSIAYGCAKAMRELGADLALTYLNEKAKPHVQPLAESLGAELFVPCDVTRPGELEAVYAEIGKRWGVLHSALHSMAFAPRQDLQGRLVDSSLEGFQVAMDVSCHSFVRMARLAEPLMQDGGTLFTMTYLGATRAIRNYNLMGPVKAALESVTRYLALELGPKIRVHAVSPGPLKTRAASGLADFDQLMAKAAARAPARQLATIDDVGRYVAFLATDAGRILTGDTLFVDGGYHIAD